MRALITKGGAAQPDNAADGLAEEEKLAVATSSSMVVKDLHGYANGKSQNVKNVTWGANTVQELHVEYNGSCAQDDVDMSAEEAGDAAEVRKDTSANKMKKMV